MFALGTWLATTSARAETPSPEVATAEPPAPCRTPERRALAGAATLVPGVLLHGSGHFALCEKKTAYRLLAMEGVGAVSLVGSTAGLAATGASRYLVAPLAIGAWAGASLFVLSFLADIYGVTNADPDRPIPIMKPSLLAVETGARYVYDPQFSHRVFLSQSFRLDLSTLWLEPRWDFALDEKNQRYALLAGHRLLGATPKRPFADGSYLEVRAGIADHAYSEEGFAMTTLEGSLAGRFDLGRFAKTLRGSFAEAELGLAHQWSRFEGFDGDQTDELLLRTTFGSYWGGGAVQGETRFGYVHRRDTLAGGMRVSGIPAGYLGYVETRSEAYFGSFGVATEVTYGAAFIVGAALLFRVEP